MAFNSEPTIVKRNIQRASPYLIQKNGKSLGDILVRAKLMQRTDMIKNYHPIVFSAKFFSRMFSFFFVRSNFRRLLHLLFISD